MTTETNALLFAGDLFTRFKDPQTNALSAPQSLEVDRLEIQAANERKEKLSKKKATFGQPFVSFAVPQPSEFNITFSEVSRQVFAMMLAARMEALTVASAAITDHEVTIAALDIWTPTGKKYIDPEGFAVKNQGGTVTYVKDVDYRIDYELGYIMALSTGAIGAGAIVLSGNTEAINGTRLRGAQQYNQVMYIELNGINLVTRKRMILEAPQASVASETAYDFMGGELAEAQLSGRLEIASGWTEPYRLDYLD